MDRIGPLGVMGNFVLRVYKGLRFGVMMDRTWPQHFSLISLPGVLYCSNRMDSTSISSLRCDDLFAHEFGERRANYMHTFIHI